MTGNLNSTIELKSHSTAVELENSNLISVNAHIYSEVSAGSKFQNQVILKDFVEMQNMPMTTSKNIFLNPSYDFIQNCDSPVTFTVSTL